MNPKWAITSNDDDTVTLEVGSVVAHISAPTHRHAHDAAQAFAKAYVHQKTVDVLYRESQALKREVKDVFLLSENLTKALERISVDAHHLEEDTSYPER